MPQLAHRTTCSRSRCRARCLADRTPESTTTVCTRRRHNSSPADVYSLGSPVRPRQVSASCNARGAPRHKGADTTGCAGGQDAADLRGAGSGARQIVFMGGDHLRKSPLGSESDPDGMITLVDRVNLVTKLVLVFRGEKCGILLNEFFWLFRL
jgi:hypothetical protein